MLATVLNRSSDWETGERNIEAGSSPVGVLSSATAALFPANRPCFADPDIERVRIEAGIDCSKVRIDPNLTFTISARPYTPVEPQRLDLVLPTHIDHDGAVVSAASVRVRALGGVLSESEMIAVLTLAGWPTELIPQALAVSYCESKWSPYASGDSGNSIGLFQLNRLWFGYAGEDVALWADPVVNSRVALATYRYDLSRGYRPWSQWSCRSAVY